MATPKKDDSSRLNIWFDMLEELPIPDPKNVRGVYFLSSVDDPEARTVVICRNGAELQKQLDDGVFSGDTPYSHWMQWFPTEETFQVSIGNLQNVAGSATFLPPP